MLRYVFVALVVTHGLIHLMGFAKAFRYAEISQLTRDISRPAGVFWLSTAVLFIAAAILYFIRSASWVFPGVAALILSQALILSHWTDARAGTIANVIILLVLLPALGDWFFDKMVRREVRDMMEAVQAPADPVIRPDDTIGLPPIVKTWLQRSGALNRPSVYWVHLRQAGQMRTKPDARWMPFSAEQWFDIIRGNFLWTTRVEAIPTVYMTGRDKWIDGQGQMLICLLSLYPVVNEGPDEKINSGSALRYLGELCWFPSAALGPNVTWSPVDSRRARATLLTPGGSVSGIYTFSAEGDLVSFEADRYYGNGPDARLTPWRVETTDWKAFDGIRLPFKHRVTWRLPEGDFTWLTLEITDIRVNDTELVTD